MRLHLQRQVGSHVAAASAQCSQSHGLPAQVHAMWTIYAPVALPVVLSAHTI